MTARKARSTVIKRYPSAAAVPSFDGEGKRQWNIRNGEAQLSLTWGRENTAWIDAAENIATVKKGVLYEMAAILGSHQRTG